jgi:hypothetical protein
MSTPITIGQQTISFPTSGDPQNWAPAIVAFAEAVQEKFLTVGSPYDLPPIVVPLNSNVYPPGYLPGQSLKITNAYFNHANVRSFQMSYAIYRASSITSNCIAETGVLTGVYNNGTSSWELEDNYIGPRNSDGTPYHTLTINSDYIYLNTTSVTSYTTGTFSYSARTQLVTNV